jgi:tetraacyldisaccharide 4'-kinase
MSETLKFLLAPIAWIYGLVVWIRNLLYDEHILYSAQVSIPTICVGNLAVGGTGKTPMTEYLVSLLSEQYKVAVLSRGYGRQTNGFRLANEQDTAQTIGDEPMQIHTRFPKIPVAVCADRVKGVKRLKYLFPDIQCVILDDAYQHRSLRCGMYILLTPYNRLYVHDHMLPCGRLRDVPSQSIRANVVVVTKCPEHMQPIDRRVVANALQLPSYQQLVFSHITYQPLSLPGTPLLVTGIANPQPILAYLREQYPNTELLAFPDHHIFTNNDLEIIRAKAENYICVVTTEKDYMRLQHTALVKQLGNKLYVQTIKTDFGIDKEAFDRAIRLYISENNRNSKH